MNLFNVDKPRSLDLIVHDGLQRWRCTLPNGGSFHQLVKTLLPTLAASGLAAVRKAFAQARVIRDPDTKGRRHLLAPTVLPGAIAAYVAAAQSRGQEPLLADAALVGDANAGLNPLCSGALAFFASQVFDDPTYFDDAKVPFVLDLAKATLEMRDREPPFGQGVVARLDLNAIEGLSAQALAQAIDEGQEIPWVETPLPNALAENAAIYQRWLDRAREWGAGPFPVEDPPVAHSRVRGSWPSAAGLADSAAQSGPHEPFVAGLGTLESDWPTVLVAEMALAEAWSHLPTLCTRVGKAMVPDPKKGFIGLYADFGDGLSDPAVAALVDNALLRLSEVWPHMGHATTRHDQSTGQQSETEKGRRRQIVRAFGAVEFQPLRAVDERLKRLRALSADDPALPAHRNTAWLLGVAWIEPRLLAALPPDFLPDSDVAAMAPAAASAARQFDTQLTPGARQKRFEALPPDQQDQVKAGMGAGEWRWFQRKMNRPSPPDPVMSFRRLSL